MNLKNRAKQKRVTSFKYLAHSLHNNPGRICSQFCLQIVWIEEARQSASEYKLKALIKKVLTRILMFKIFFTTIESKKNWGVNSRFYKATIEMSRSF